MAASHVPDGLHRITPYIIVKGADRAIEFYRQALGAETRERLEDKQGRVVHAELVFGDSVVMIAEEIPQMNIRGPETLGGSPVALLMYVDDVDAAFERAIAAGAKMVRPVQDQFYGDRSGTLSDPFGHVWTLGTHKEDVPPDELRRRFEALCGGRK